MAPPTAPLNLDVEAISGICGSISIACWVVVFSPQIIENFRRSSAEGLSIQFVIVWLLGDVFNILGAVLQGVLPTMIILAIYYTIADVVLLLQCFYYRGFTWRDEVAPTAPKPKPRRRTGEPDERTNLLAPEIVVSTVDRERRGSDWSNLSPALPLVSTPSPPPAPFSRLQTVAFNAVAVVMVCAAGFGGWYLSRGSPTSGAEPGPDGGEDSLEFNFWGQVFGWFCAVLYLGSRLPQLLLNCRRKSTEGLSVLFFLFACLGNLTYVLSIVAYEPKCQASECQPGEAKHIYAQYILVNLSWLAGSAGTLFLDMAVFVQFFIYSRPEEEDEDEDGFSDDEVSIDGSRWDQRPVLERNSSDYTR